jgi:2-polyprenyl-3-methyl-5-hydroxy-6-metoxy-1,4-benzoquinol methylase
MDLSLLRKVLSPRPAVVPPEGDDIREVSPPLECTQAEVDRWNDEWIDYLRREWMYQFIPHNELPETPPLPDDPMDMLRVSVRPGWELGLYCDRDALEGKAVMEMGCGCGGLAKQAARYTQTYLGTDYSTLALMVARLVSPPNCTYIHVGDKAGLSRHFGRIDTVVSRHFWIHQNMLQAGRNLDFLALFLKPGGRLYADFFWPNPAEEQFIVRSPDEPLSRKWPSAMFRYTPEDVRKLIDGRPFRVLREAISKETQRRYVVLERLSDR